MDSQAVFARLRNALAHLYPTNESARRIADDAGLDARRIRFSTQALENWHAILAEGVRVGRLDNLLSVAQAEYGSNSELLVAADLYHRFVEQGGRIVPPLPQRMSKDEQRAYHNRQVMLQRVKSFWIEGVLKHSLYQEVLIRLHLQERPDAVDNRPWNLIQRAPGRDDQLLPANIHILDVFEQMNRELLILGEPGSGKTSLLLGLADALLKQAEADATSPLPVVFNLSSWTRKREPLGEWLIAELRTKYNIPQQVAQQWVEDDELLLLLDGLDEVATPHRGDCVRAINQFHQDHLIRLVVCSRVAEYESLTSQLKLQGAVLVQPLILPQIDEYLDLVCRELSTLRTILHHDPEFQELASSPLMLSVMTLAYQNASTAEITEISSTETRRQHLFDAYIRRMFAHRDIPQIYPIQKSLHWLAWLAANMYSRQQTIFLIEGLQPNWIQISSRVWVYVLTGLSIGLLFALFGALLGILLGTLFDALLGALLGALFGILFGWLTVGVFAEVSKMEFKLFRFEWNKGVGRSLFRWLSNIEPVEERKFDWGKGLMVGLATGLGGGLGHILIGGVAGRGNWLLFALSAGLSTGLFVALSGRKDISQTANPNHGIWRSSLNMLNVGLSIGLTVGLCAGLVDGLDTGLFMGLFMGLFSGLSSGGEAAIKHLVLRTLLWCNNYAPLNYARFLDYSHQRILLRKVGGGYIFIHRLLMEHFAALTEEHIKRLAGSSDGR